MQRKQKEPEPLRERLFYLIKKAHVKERLSRKTGRKKSKVNQHRFFARSSIERETKNDGKHISPDCTVHWLTAADRRKGKGGQDFPLSEKQQIHKSKLITRWAICSFCDLLSPCKGFEASVRCSFMLPPAVIVVPITGLVSVVIKVLFPPKMFSPGF